VCISAFSFFLGQSEREMYCIKCIFIVTTIFCNITNFKCSFDVNVVFFTKKNQFFWSKGSRHHTANNLNFYLISEHIKSSKQIKKSNKCTVYVYSIIIFLFMSIQMNTFL